MPRIIHEERLADGYHGELHGDHAYPVPKKLYHATRYANKRSGKESPPAVLEPHPKVDCLTYDPIKSPTHTQNYFLILGRVAVVAERKY